MNHFEKLLGLLFFISTLVACNSGTDNPAPKIEYKGPTMQSANITTLYSDSAQLKIKLNAKMQWQFENGNAEYPEGINLTFYDRNQQVSSTLRANYAKYDKQRDSYFGRGNVVVHN
ncbi:MAG: LPS export ABC transporter periplasmic protein LptC, partial [Bacteroidota bacterium]|nr:LPS export ABC transporter periplasmic protein LptC [Bacteroidota bacterium]